MYLEYTTKEHEKVAFYAYTNPDRSELIGMAEGYLGIRNDLVTVIKIIPEFQNKGFGFKLFTEVFQHLSAPGPISTVVGSWEKGNEFSYCEDGQSTNLSVFQQLRDSGFTDKEAAFGTPTGKWAHRMGYNLVDFKVIGRDYVHLEFTKTS
ncbi:hypothetical protein GCM10022246_24860 [Pedobacter ginsengiterrae]|uniref:N-acetyltransferase domain-containing protein n=1 Tax=Pedobacter ginsengiterrae TaxID=871696 RepID=A0ABP7PU80_9SPHI